MAETQEQISAIKWFRETFPNDVMALCCSQTGGYIGRGRAAAIRTAKKKAMGMVVGEADIRILLPRGGFTFFMSEHKGAGQSHTLSNEQEAHLDYHNANGACAVSTRGLEALQAAILAYMQGRWVRSENGVLYCAELIAES